LKIIVGSKSEKAARDIGWKALQRNGSRKPFVAWKRSLRDGGILHPLFEILWSRTEIESYKWIESEKRGMISLDARGDGNGRTGIMVNGDPCDARQS